MDRSRLTGIFIARKSNIQRPDIVLVLLTFSVSPGHMALMSKLTENVPVAPPLHLAACGAAAAAAGIPLSLYPHTSSDSVSV